MQFDRKTINLILQIKRSLPEEQKQAFKLSAPDLLDQIRHIHQTTNRKHTKELLEQLAGLGDGAFDSLLAEKKHALYRGVPINKNANNMTTVDKEAKPGLMYRGQVVEA